MKFTYVCAPSLPLYSGNESSFIFYFLMND